MSKKEEKIHIAAVSDIHCHENSGGMYQDLFTQISNEADLLLLCGDLTDYGQPKEAEVLTKELLHCKIPVVAILGNHDYESDKNEELVEILTKSDVTFLQGSEYIFEKGSRKIGITGVKGFGGGFKPAMWERFGEKEQKAYYDALTYEIQHLEIGLNRLQPHHDLPIIVMLHFSPIRQTLHGELEELYPFLGSTRLEEVIDRYNVRCVFHGHSHFGTGSGTTEKGIPVYNVSYPLLKELNPEKPYALVEL
ncbi:MAG: metallophosphoesterase [Candidatus Levybacteria bacterium]|nr:metallophosphoesterase [Candidatus Levybacteria bacterium]